MLPVILDGDPGHDDAIAWLLAAASDELDIRAIVSVAGNAPLARTSQNARQIASLYGLTDVPIAEGQRRPLTREPMAAPSVHGESGLDGPTLPPARVGLSPLGGVALMAKVLRESADPVTIIATGPLTNVATLLLSYPELKAKIGQISVMGGGLLTGNWTPAAEFNILVDPEAAKIVFESGIPLLIAPLDVTEKAYVLPSDAERVRQIGSPLAEIVADWLDFFYKFHAELGYPGGPVHDPVAVVALTHPEILTMRDLYVQVETSGDYCTGATIGDFFNVSGKPPNARVVLGIDRAAYVDLIVEAVRRLS